MNIIDYIILAIILISILIGFKNGIINSIVTFAGTLLVIVLAFYLKNPISELLYQYLPFFKLGGKFAEVVVFNVLIYEGISYLITISLLSILLGIISRVTGVFNRLINATLVLGLPSKILGAICGFFQGYIIAFIIVFVLGLISGTATLVNNSMYADTLITKTPVLSNIVEKTYYSITDVYKIVSTHADDKDKTDANLESLEVLLKYDILSIKSADKLISSGKLKVDGASEIINRYRGEEK